MPFTSFSTIFDCSKKLPPFIRNNYMAIALMVTLTLYILIYFRLDTSYQSHVDVTEEIYREYSHFLPSLRDSLQTLIYGKKPPISQVHAVLERWVTHHQIVTSFSVAELDTNGTIRALSGSSLYQDTTHYTTDSILHTTMLHCHHAEKPILRVVHKKLMYTTKFNHEMMPHNLQHFSILLDVDLGTILDAKSSRRIVAFLIVFFIFLIFLILCNVNLFYGRVTSSTLLRLFIPLTAVIVVYLASIGFFIVNQHRAMQTLYFLANNLTDTVSSNHFASTCYDPDPGLATSLTLNNPALHGTTDSFVHPYSTNEHLKMYLEELHKKQHQQTEFTLFLGLIFFTLGTYVLFSRLSGLNLLINSTTSRNESLSAQHEAILTHANVGIAVHEMIFDQNGRPSDYVFLNTNPAFDRITGLDSKNIIGKRVTEVMPGIEKSNFISLYGNVVKTGTSLSTEEFSDQLQKHFSINVFVIQQNVFGVIFYDVTDRIAAVSFHHLSTLVFENIPIGLHVYRVDSSGEVPSFSLISSNRSANFLLKYYYVNDTGKSPGFFFEKADEHDLVSELEAAFKSGIGNTRFEIICKIPTGDERTFLFTYFSLPDTRIALLFEDITKQRKTQNELAASQLELATALADSKRMTKDMQQAIELRHQFLTNMTHELHTPLTGIIGMSTILTRTLKNTSQYHQICAIQSNANYLYRHINNILDVAQIDSGSLFVSPVNFHLDIDVITVLSDLYYKEALKKGIRLILTIDKDTELGLIGDSDKLIKILSHILDNAIKFTEKGVVSLQVKSSGKRDDSIHLNFIIDDSGIGISEERQQKLFSKFVQVDSSTSRPFGGTGLGLYIAKHLAEHMQGSISFTSVCNLGSTFYITLPFKIRTSLSEPVFSTSKPTSGTGLHLPAEAKKRILLVEDNTINQELASLILSSINIDFDIAENGVSALRMLKHMPYDLIFMDCQMPEMDGYETTRQLRSSLGKNTTVPVVALTAHFTDEDRQKCLGAGMNDYLTKPISIAKVKAVLKAWVSPDISIQDFNKEVSPAPPISITPLDTGIWNRAAMLELCMNDESIMSKVIGEFLVSTTRYIEDLTAAFRSRDLKKIAKSAHTIKGVAATLCADSLKENAAHLVHLADTGEIRDYTLLLNDIINQFVILKSMLTKDFIPEKL